MAQRAKLSTQLQEAERESRPIRMRKYKLFILIVCEDTKTEPAYFESFKQEMPGDSIFLRTVGTGRDPLGVIQQTIQEREQLKSDTLKEIDQVWAVFDIDDANENETKRTKFRTALAIAQNEKIHLAYSNEVFELWLLLHLADVSSEQAIPRNTLYKLLQNEVRKSKKYATYEYNHRKIDSMFLSMIKELGDEDTAISRAKILEETQKGKDVLLANPNTRVHYLVQELREWIKYYNY